MTQQERALPDILKSLDQERIRSYKDLLDFYNGTQWLTQSRRERQLTFNYARVSIDKATSYLMSGLDFAVDPLEDSDQAKQKAREAEAAIYQAYQQNNCEALDFETEVDAAILGDGAYKVTWDAQEKQVRITAPDVQGLWAWTRGDDPSQVRRVASRYQLSAEEARERYGVDVSGKTTDVIEDWTATAVEVWAGAERVSSGPNPYGFIPFVIFPNIREPKKFWGASDIPAIRETQRELNRALSQLFRILEVSGNPIAVLENVEESEDIAVARNIPSAEMVAGRYLAVQVFGGRPDPKEAVVVAVFT